VNFFFFSGGDNQPIPINQRRGQRCKISAGYGVLTFRLLRIASLAQLLRLKTHGVENRRRFSPPKTDMADKDDNSAVAAALFISIVENLNKNTRKRNKRCIYTNSVLFTNKPNKNNKLQPIRTVFLSITCFRKSILKYNMF